MRHSNRWGAPEWETFEVEKVFKNGRFTLKGRDGQWNAYPPRPNDGYGEPYWYAYRAGDSRYRDGTIFIWNNESSSFINEGFAMIARERRLKKLQQRFERLRYGDITDVALDAIEAALASRQD